VLLVDPIVPAAADVIRAPDSDQTRRTTFSLRRRIRVARKLSA